jgi:hypothetical protein
LDWSQQKLVLVHILARVAVAFVWIYHGVVPKLIYQHPDELTIIRKAGVSFESAPEVVRWIGVVEIVVGLLVIVGIPSVRLPLILTVVLGIGATIGVAIQSPEFLIAAFNPVSLNVCVVALSLVGLLSISRSSS